MAARKKRRKKAGLLWRFLFGHNGPTKTELKKLLRLSFSNTFVIPVRDPATGLVRKQRMRIDKDGRVLEAKAPAKKNRPAPKKVPGKQGASKASKASRASKTGSAPRKQTQAGAAPAAHRAKPVPLAERVRRNPDGTLNGSRRDPATQERQRYAQAQREYAKAMKNADTASKRAEYLLGWQQQPPPRRSS
jgi:hypothetical protein